MFIFIRFLGNKIKRVVPPFFLGKKNILFSSEKKCTQKAIDIILPVRILYSIRFAPLRGKEIQEVTNYYRHTIINIGFYF